MKNFITVFTLSILFVATSQATSLYPYNRLILKDLDQMNKLVKDKIKEARKSGDKSGPLREAMQAVYSRPNEDFMIEKIVGPLKSELEEADGWEPMLRSLVDESVNGLKKPDDLKEEAQITYAVMLENIMSELKPDARGAFEKGIFVQIRDAKIQLSRKAANKRALNTMRAVKSPSEIADLILRDLEKRQAQTSKEEESEVDKRGPLSKQKSAEK